MALHKEIEWEFKPVKYLTETAVQILKSKFDLPQHKALSILAKSLLFKNIDDLYEEYVPDEYGYYYYNSLIFSEFVFAKKLDLNFKEAYQLKQELDYYYCYNSRNSAGNIDFANFSLMSNYSYDIDQGNEARIMFDYPVSFYCRILDQNFELKCGAKYELESLWCDGFSFSRIDYFLDEANAILYARTILEILLTYNHLIISHLVIENWIKNHNYLYQYVVDNFECHLAYGTWWSDKIEEYGLYIPKGSKSLESRLNIPNPLSDVMRKNCSELNLGQKIKLFRIKKNLRQEDLSDICGVTIKTISNWENNRNYPDLFNLKNLCSCLSVSLDEFSQY